MREPVDSPDYWRKKLSSCKGELHRVMFEGSIEYISRQEMGFRVQLEKQVGPEDSVLDCGCGYGRLLYLLPHGWRGRYVGVDVSPDFINLAKSLHPDRVECFLEGDLRHLDKLLFAQVNGRKQFDVAVVAWVRSMVERHLGAGEWRKMEEQITKYADRVIYLEGA